MIRTLASLAALSLAFFPTIAAPAKKPASRPAVKAPPVGQVRLPVLSYTVHASGPATGERAKRRDS